VSQSRQRVSLRRQRVCQSRQRVCQSRQRVCQSRQRVSQCRQRVSKRSHAQPATSLVALEDERVCLLLPATSSDACLPQPAACLPQPADERVCLTTSASLLLPQCLSQWLCLSPQPALPSLQEKSNKDTAATGATAAGRSRLGVPTN
jgi:hypothetical protein